MGQGDQILGCQAGLTPHNLHVKRYSIVPAFSQHVRSAVSKYRRRLMEWSGRAPAPPASEAGKGVPKTRSTPCHRPQAALDQLGQLRDDEVIFARRPWTLDTEAEIGTLEGENLRVPQEV